jgi:hypothetical protein
MTGTAGRKLTCGFTWSMTVVANAVRIQSCRYRASDTATRGGVTSNAATLRARSLRSLPVLRMIELSVEAAQARKNFHRWFAHSKV